MGPWFAHKKPFAKGVMFEVFRKKTKKRMQYPKKSYFLHRGNVVKVNSREFSVSEGFKNYWGLKIIHEIFPKNTVQVTGLKIVADAQKQPAWGELHVKEVPLHKELIALNKAIHTNDPQHMRGLLTAACMEVFESHAPAVSSLESVMRSAGINPSTENAYNVSFANPKRPIFLEPKIKYPQKLRRFIERAHFSIEKKERLLRYLARFEAAEHKS